MAATPENIEIKLDLKTVGGEPGPQRGTWRFFVPVLDIRAAAEKQLAYHEKRIEYWRPRLKRADKAVTKSLKARSIAVTNGTQTVYESDPAARQVREVAESRLSRHENRAEVLREWVAFLKLADEDGKVFITQADAVFFNLSGHTPEDA